MDACPNCGTELKPGMRFCPLCETEVEQEEKLPEVKFCYHCGSKVEDRSAVCVKCGALLKTPVIENVNARTLQIAAYVVLMLGLVLLSFGLICLIGYAILSKINNVFWLAFPMSVWLMVHVIATRHYAEKTQNRGTVSAAYKICVFLFINPVAGVLMLCDDSGANQVVWKRKTVDINNE